MTTKCEAELEKQKKLYDEQKDKFRQLLQDVKTSLADPSTQLQKDRRGTTK
tara:strand:+ start:112 stop:264 length:153 start_codon:yes stop_codon:yes gene_type:complete